MDSKDILFLSAKDNYVHFLLPDAIFYAPQQLLIVQLRFF